jgi:hypothetical protein
VAVVVVLILFQEGLVVMVVLYNRLIPQLSLQVESMEALIILEALEILVYKLTVLIQVELEAQVVVVKLVRQLEPVESVGFPEAVAEAVAEALTVQTRGLEEQVGRGEL